MVAKTRDDGLLTRTDECAGTADVLAEFITSDMIQNTIQNIIQLLSQQKRKKEKKAPKGAKPFASTS
ncbi:MAG: hypothetical protein R6U32_05530 [Candidatus Woesearchaeota archaeon]